MAKNQKSMMGRRDPFLISSSLALKIIAFSFAELMNYTVGRNIPSQKTVTQKSQFTMKKMLPISLRCYLFLERLLLVMNASVQVRASQSITRILDIRPNLIGHYSAGFKF